MNKLKQIIVIIAYIVSLSFTKGCFNEALLLEAYFYAAVSLYLMAILFVLAIDGIKELLISKT